MIPTSELRIGNWVSYTGGPPFQVKDITNNAINIDYGEYEMNGWEFYDDGISPIPLSPEVLLACGFTKFIDMEISKKEKKDIYMYFLKTDYVQITFVYGETVLIGNDGFGAQAQCALWKSIKSLHQLQNLYFALTSKELIYQP